MILWMIVQHFVYESLHFWCFGMTLRCYISSFPRLIGWRCSLSVGHGYQDARTNQLVDVGMSEEIFSHQNI